MLCLKCSAVFSHMGAEGRIATEFIKTKCFIFTYSWSFERLSWIINQHVMQTYCVPGTLPMLNMCDFI